MTFTVFFHRYSSIPLILRTGATFWAKHDAIKEMKHEFKGNSRQSNPLFSNRTKLTYFLLRFLCIIR